MGWSTHAEIVAELLARGIKFQVCVQAPLYREPILSQHGARLGFRPSGYRPTAVDHAAYQQRLDAYLHSSRGRAALCAGGVIGRLAREIVPDALVVIGPSDEVFDTGVRLWDGQGQTAYWDDSLTADEIDLICGVYVVATVNSADEDGVQKKELSWWPKPGAFSQSGLNIGWWSPDCERWFRKRCKEIKRMQAELFTQSEWKHKIRYIQKSRQVAAANEKIAAEYLQSL
ncbi:hypothetical protein DFH06DRAFT_982656 [Mycena polygramma]|nr:hypothetical protein DFH06DRAFT_982656 [Mycena polygramma]